MTSPNNINIAIFASGSGSNAQVLIEKAISLGHPIRCVITDKRNAGVIKRCKKLNTPYHVISFFSIEGNRYQEDKSLHEKRILKVLDKYKINWIFLAGYMRILSEEFLSNFYNKNTKQNNVINIHPSLLPDFPGKQAYHDAYMANINESGVTVHFVDSGIDTGKIITQKKFERLPNDSFETFNQRGLKVEHQIFPYVLEQLYINPHFYQKGIL